MKTRLFAERLEDRRVLSTYTIDILDTQHLVDSATESKMYTCMKYVFDNIAKYVSWKGTLDARLDVRAGGSISAIMSVLPDRTNAVIKEMLTGWDSCGTQPEVGAILSVENGAVTMYGMKAYYDPNPAQYVPANVPAGCFDFVGVMTHEIFHGLGFQFGTNEFSRYVTSVNNVTYFNGPNTVAALGRPLPMSPSGGTHYGNTYLPDNPIGTGLMFQWGNYAGNRLDIGRLDLAVLKDLGLNVYNTAGLPLVDRIDSFIPRTTVSSLAVDENVPIGTTVGTLSTTAGSSGYSFQVLSSDFRVVGNNLVTNVPLDYERKNSYTFTVRNIDRDGAWTDAPITVSVRDLPEATIPPGTGTGPTNPTINLPSTPYLFVPVNFAARNGVLPLGAVNLYGDDSTTPSVFIFSKGGTFSVNITDPAVTVYLVNNSSGGQTLCLVGKASALNRNMKNISYRGNQPTLAFQMCAGGNNLASVTANIKYA